MRIIPTIIYDMSRKNAPAIGLILLSALMAGGCAETSDNAAASDARGAITIVASTNVYGDIARAVAGEAATVTSIITSSTQDPHEYEASAQDRLALDDADVVIENGGGYDPFVDTLMEGSDGDVALLTAVDVSGLPDGHDDGDTSHEDEAAEDEAHEHVEGFNEHVWYDLHAVEHLAEELSHTLGEIDPEHAENYQANYEAFARQIEDLEESAADLRASAAGRGVAITEPLPVYLLEEVGLVNRTPEDFSEAVEEGADVPPRVLQETLDLFDGTDIALLAYNEQTADSTTEQVRAAAEAAGVPVVDFTETLPSGQSYVEWQRANLDNLAAALG